MPFKSRRADIENQPAAKVPKVEPQVKDVLEVQEQGKHTGYDYTCDQVSLLS